MTDMRCIACAKVYDIKEVRYACSACNSLLAIHHDPAKLQKLNRATFEARLTSRKPVDQSGVWRYREAVLDLADDQIVTHPEGATRIYWRRALADWCGVERATLKHEGENPTGSFKDRGMTVAVSQAKRLGLQTVACASTGNTSAALAAYAAQAGMKALVLIPSGKIALGKLAQALAYGATCVAVRGDFDQAMTLVQEAAQTLGVYLVNSLNPFRLEGQKTIMWEMLHERGWRAPDFVVVPGGNLGNTSAFGKALIEAKAAGWIDKLPRLVVVQAKGANPFYESWRGGFAARKKMKADTVATAIMIGDPVNYEKARVALAQTAGLVTEVSDQELMAAKAEIDRAGIGCEPASACSLAGIKKLRAEGVISAADDVVGILTGNLLKDPDAILSASGGKSRIKEIDPDMKSLDQALREGS